MMLSINVPMTLTALLILPVSMLIINGVMKRSQKYFRDQQKYLGEVNGQIEENYGGHNVVIEVISWVILWFRLICRVSTSFVTLERISPFVRLSK